MKSFKKIIIIVLTAVMLTSVFALPASASGYAGANGTISVSYSVPNIKLQLAELIADVANSAIEILVSIAQKSPNPDISALLSQTEAISAAAISAINALGFEAECEYVEYIINGQSVMIDPIIVIKRD